MSHPNPYSEEIEIEYFEKNTDFAKYVWAELEIAKDKCSSWWVDKPTFMKYPVLWKNGYLAKKAMKKKSHGGKRKGAGRKGFGGTTLVRVPNAILKLVKKMIADWKKAQKPD